MNQHKQRMVALKRLNKTLGFTPPRDGLMMVVTKQLCIDLVRFDKMLADHDTDYDCINCTYKKKKGVSMLDYIKEKFGEQVLTDVNLLTS